MMENKKKKYQLRPCLPRSLCVILILTGSLSWVRLAEGFCSPSRWTIHGSFTASSTPRLPINRLRPFISLFEQVEKKRRSPLENLNLLQKNKSDGSLGFLRTRFPNFPWYNIPNWLTYARCAAIPLLIWFFYQPFQNYAASFIFAGASLTDYLDGYLARRWDCSTKFGAFLDPVADKLMVSTALVLLSGRYGMYLAIPSCIILARELAVSALREWMAQIGARDTVKVGWQGKCKTALTMVALTVLLLAPPLAASQSPLVRFCLPLGLLLGYAATLLTITSGWVYFAAAAPYLMENED